MDRIFNSATGIFDPLHNFWENNATQRVVAGILVLIFLLALGTIELNRQKLLPFPLSASIPVTHYMAINLALTLVLIIEVVSLIFTLPCSISKALGKQFEILVLIFCDILLVLISMFPARISRRVPQLGLCSDHPAHKSCLDRATFFQRDDRCGFRHLCPVSDLGL